MYVLDALRVRLLQHLFDDLLPDVRSPHRWQRDREVVEGDGELHAGPEKIVQGFHLEGLQQRAFDGDARLGERLRGSGRVDHTRSLRQLLVVEPVPRVEPHRGAVLIKNGSETRTAHRCRSLRSLKHFSTLRPLRGLRLSARSSLLKRPSLVSISASL